MSFLKNKNKTGFLAYENSSGIIKNCNLLQSTSNVQLNYLKIFFYTFKSDPSPINILFKVVLS